MNQELQHYLAEKQTLINLELINRIESLPVNRKLKESMLYSIKAGGKRLRPILLLATAEAFGKKEAESLPVACALEMVHTYSLIHDDLPAMDNDDLRRGLPTNHKKFDEATAILAGDGLLTYSFELLSRVEQIPAAVRMELVGMLADAAGPKGMVGGQLMDMEAERKQITLEDLERVHSLKTGRLLEFAILAGAKLGNATGKQLKSLGEFSYYLGIVFQVQDDILDVSGDPEKLGKPVGSDETNLKSTYPGLLGLEGAIDKKREYSQNAMKALTEAGMEYTRLSAVTEYFGSRDH